MIRLYQEKRYDKLTKLFHDILDYYSRHPVTNLTAPLEDHINAFVENFLYFLTKPDYAIPSHFVVPLIGCQPIIANLVAISHFRSTDPQLALLSKQENNFVKLLMLYSPRNRIQIDPKVFFDADARLASLWYAIYPLCAAAATSRLLEENLNRHIAMLDERFSVPDERIAPLYYRSTYLNPGRDRVVKTRLNRAIRRQIGDVIVPAAPKPERVAILTSKWFPASAVYRSSFPLVEALRERYRLTLVHLGPENPDVDGSLFEKVLHVELVNGRLEAGSIVNNDFQVAYYPDIGMSPESIWLSNMRVAPIQVTSYGHPVSTFGSRIDYFIGGVLSEPPEKAQEHYSERLVLIPGLGAHPVYPKYRPKLPSRSDGAITMNIPWECSKINYPMLMNLKAVQDRACRPVRLQFFPGPAVGQYNAALPFLEDVDEIFGKTATVMGYRGYSEYMELMEQANLSLDSYPFGGYNTIVDSLHLRKPVVTYEGTRFYNRVASALLRKLGFEELVARSDEQYIEKAVRLVDDDDYRRRICEALRTMDLRARIFDTDEPKYLRKAIDYLVQNHDTLKDDRSREPIFIK